MSKLVNSRWAFLVVVGGGGRVFVREFRCCRKIGLFLTQLGYKGIELNEYRPLLEVIFSLNMEICIF